MEQITRQTCVECHFLCEANISTRPDAWQHSTLPRARRDELAKRIPTGGAALDYNPTLACDWGEWREYTSDVPVTRLDEVTKNRSDLCFFWPYQPGQSLQAARIKQQRGEDRDKLLESRRFASIAIFIAGLGLFFNLLDSLPKIADLLRSLMSASPTLPPYP